MSLLRIQGIFAGYGESVVLQDMNLEINAGEVVCLLGPNGAGKSTSTRVITGLLKPWSGEVFFEERNINAIPAHKRVNLGISLAPEGRYVFPNLTVHENLLLGSFSTRARRHRAKSLAAMYELFPRLRERRQQKAGLMSGGEQQMLAIARALMGRPSLLILDEPSLGLAPKIVLDVFAAVARIAESGISILFVEQNAHAALAAADRGYVLANGRVSAKGTADELKRSQVLEQAFLGGTAPPNGGAQENGQLRATSTSSDRATKF